MDRVLHDAEARIHQLEAGMIALTEENVMLRAALKQAAEDLEDWGAYVKANNARAILEEK